MTNVSVAGEFIEFEQPKLSSSKLAQALLTVPLTEPSANYLNSVTFAVLGTPVPQGSMRAFKNRVMANNAEALASWRSDVTAAAHRHKPEEWNINAAVSLQCEFVFKRPLSHYGTGKNANKLKASAPVHHVKTPDLDKIVRSVSDSIGDAVASVFAAQ